MTDMEKLDRLGEKAVEIMKERIEYHENFIKKFESGELEDSEENRYFYDNSKFFLPEYKKLLSEWESLK